MVLKMGSKGIMACQPHTLMYQPAVKPAEIRDRTGAGDVAAAGFIFGALMRLGLETCLEIAALCASKSIEGYGRSAYPDRGLSRTIWWNHPEIRCNPRGRSMGHA